MVFQLTLRGHLTVAVPAPVRNSTLGFRAVNGRDLATCPRLVAIRNAPAGSRALVSAWLYAAVH